MTGVAFAGLGSMGQAMVKRLLSQGHQVTVWNRSPAAADELVELGAHRAGSITEAFEAGPVLSMLANDDAANQVFDKQTLAAAPDGAIHVNLATVSLGAARELTERHAAAGVGYLAVPVLGRPPVAQAGQLNLLAAGDPQVLAQIQPVLDSLGKTTWRFGDEPAQANIAKICMNYLLIHSLQAMAEAQTLAESYGLDNRVLVELTSNSFFPGPVYAGYGREIAEKNYLPAAFTTTLGAKDLRLAREAAAATNVDLPTAPTLQEVFDTALQLGFADQDWASIAEVTRQRAGRTPGSSDS